LAALGHQVTVIAWDRAAEMPAQEVLPSGVHVTRVQHVPSAYGEGARQILRLPLFWRAALPMLSRQDPGVVHCHDFDTLPAGLLWGKLHRRPVIYDAHEHYADLCRPRLHGVGGALLYRLIHFAERAGARAASAVVTVDATLATLFQRLNRRVVIVGHYPARGFTDGCAPVFTRPDLTLLYVGRLSTDRGLLGYIDLIRRLHDQGIPARLRLAGIFTPVSEEQRFREHCRGLEGAIDFVGWVPYDALAALMHTADVGLAILQPEPRYVAALPVKLFEYMAAGLPVVASNFPPIADVLNNAGCGALVDPLDAEMSADRIRHWWNHPEDARVAGENGRQAVLDRYNWEATFTGMSELYSSLIRR